GNVCSQTNGKEICVGGTCTIKCNAGFADCNANVGGCETAITTTSNCGKCGNACSTENATETCSSTSSGYACTIASCHAGWGDCNNNPSDGCEDDTNTD